MKIPVISAPLKVSEGKLTLILKHSFQKSYWHINWKRLIIYLHKALI